MALNSLQIRIAGWTGVALVVLGQLLPWGFRHRPMGQAWDALSSRVSSPNLEWWIWFLAPVAAAAVAAKALYERRPISRVVVAPAVVFFVFWALLMVSGVR